jgi:hypothetical protein
MMNVNSDDHTTAYGLVAAISVSFGEGMAPMYPVGMRLTPSAFGAMNAEIPASELTSGMSVNVEHTDASTTRVTFGSSLEEFNVFIDVESVDDEPQVVGIRVTPAEGDKFLHSSVFAKVGLSSVQRNTHEALRQPLVRSVVYRGGDTGFRDPFLTLPRPGRAGREDVEYAIWADRYVAALKVSPRSPIKYLMEQWPGFSNSALRAIIGTARKRKLLTKAGNGVAGGEITGLATELLRSHRQSITSEGE